MDPAIKTRTKAKSRYLKGKRDRRKQRKAVANANKVKQSTSKDADTDEETGNEEEVTEQGERIEDPAASHQTEDVEMQEQGPGSPLETETRKERRPKKKRRKETSRDDQDEAQEYTVPDEPQDTTLAIEKPEIPSDDHLDVQIPSFPLPSQPVMASKSQRVLQGMDSAMLDAEIVDPGLTSSLEDYANGTKKNLTPRMLKRLADLGITELFAVQTKLVPFLLPEDEEERALYQPYNPPRDVCASAPTGSGKTLAYVIPIVEILAKRVVTRLRALIIVPTRDLVQQVRETFEACSKGTKLQIASATGQQSFAHEQIQLTGNTTERLDGGSSRVDILICTPGRLIDHITGTPNFTLQHLRFLVIDEADRLLGQSFQDWLRQVLRAIQPQTADRTSISETIGNETGPTIYFPTPDAVAPAWLTSGFPRIKTDIDEPTHSSCQKLLFSATLTRDPAKIAQLDLRNPKYYIVRTRAIEDQEDGMDIDPDVTIHDETFDTPATLREWMYACESSQKPLLLFHLIHKSNIANALVFTKSAESTSRLMRLLHYFEAARVANVSSQGSQRKPLKAEAFSSDLTPSQRRAVLDSFKSQQVDLLICSDLVSRGMDISHVSHVINYDVPVDIRKYVHRVGRTARAGREGDAWSLVEEQEMHHFKAMMKEANHKKIKKLKVKSEDLKEFEEYYQTALKQLRTHYSKSE